MLFTTKRRLTKQYFLPVYFTPMFLNTGTKNETFKQDSLRHILKSSASMNESSGSQFFRTTTGIQSRPDIFDKLRLLATISTNLEVTGILCCFRLVLERKAGQEIPELSRIEFLEKFSANNFALSDAEDSTSKSLNKRDMADLPLLRMLLAICQKSCKPNFWEGIDSFTSLT